LFHAFDYTIDSPDYLSGKTLKIARAGINTREPRSFRAIFNKKAAQP